MSALFEQEGKPTGPVPVPEVRLLHRDLELETEALDEVLVLVAVVDEDVDEPQLGPAGADDEANRERQPGRARRVLRVVAAGDLDWKECQERRTRGSATAESVRNRRGRCAHRLP